MNWKPPALRKPLIRAWSSVPDPRLRAWLLWGLGLALGALAFRATLDLPLPAAALLWSAALAAGVLLAFRAEPLLWTADARTRDEEDPPLPPHEPLPRPSPPALLDMVAIAGGAFRMGSLPATAAEIGTYVAEWAEAARKKPEEVEEQAKNWREREEPAHRVRLSPFLMARVPLTRGQWRAAMPDVPLGMGDRRLRRRPAGDPPGLGPSPGLLQRPVRARGTRALLPQGCRGPLALGPTGKRKDWTTRLLPAK